MKHVAVAVTAAILGVALAQVLTTPLTTPPPAIEAMGLQDAQIAVRLINGAHEDSGDWTGYGVPYVHVAITAGDAVPGAYIVAGVNVTATYDACPELWFPSFYVLDPSRVESHGVTTSYVSESVALSQEHLPGGRRCVLRVASSLATYTVCVEGDGVLALPPPFDAWDRCVTGSQAVALAAFTWRASL